MTPEADDRIVKLEARLAEVEAELDRVRIELVEAQHEIGEGWFAGGASTAEALRRKCEALEATAAALDFDREHARIRAAALDEISVALFGPGTHTVDEVRAAVREKVARLACIEEAATRAAAELRHAYRGNVIDRNLVARAIEILERSITKESA